MRGRGATMPETSQSYTARSFTIGDEIEELDLDPASALFDELAQDWRNYHRWVGLALADYNGRHGTDYVAFEPVLGRRTLMSYFCEDSQSLIFHCGFTAALSKDVECESAATKHFCLDLHKDTEEIVSCRIVDGLDDSDCCRFCYIGISPKRSPRPDPNSTNPVREGIVVPLSEYASLFALCTEGPYDQQYKCKFPRLALAYYKKKQRKDYKLVDAVSGCVKCESVRHSMVAHCNFFARQTAHDDDAPKELFFAELEKPRNRIWVVRCCRIIKGKTKAGCYSCVGDKGQAVVHPSRGFRFGLYPYPYPDEKSRIGGRRSTLVDKDET